jgi:hypothetical protein
MPRQGRGFRERAWPQWGSAVRRFGSPCGQSSRLEQPSRRQRHRLPGCNAAQVISPTSASRRTGCRRRSPGGCRRCDERAPLGSAPIVLIRKEIVARILQRLLERNRDGDPVAADGKKRLFSMSLLHREQTKAFAPCSGLHRRPVRIGGGGTRPSSGCRLLRRAQVMKLVPLIAPVAPVMSSSRSSASRKPLLTRLIAR